MRCRGKVIITGVIASALCAVLATTGERIVLAAEKPEGSQENVTQAKEKHFLTSMEMSIWTAKGERFTGPGLMWGLVLKKNLLNAELTVHYVFSDRAYSIPIDFVFKVPFDLEKWLGIYIGAGPVLIIGREEKRTKHDFAGTVEAGLAAGIPDSDWRLCLEGNYMFRFWQELVHQGGGSIAIQYSF